MAEENTTQSVELMQDKPVQFQSDLSDIIDDAERAVRNREKSLVTNNGSVTVKHDGQVNLAGGNYSQVKLTPNGTIENISFQSVNKTNRFKVDTDDFILNNHKLNNKIYELADYKVVLEQEYPTTPKIAGGITMLGTVLVRAWEPNLKRYVMIRRLINIPLFSPSLGSTNVAPGLNITPNTEQIQSMIDTFNTSGISSMSDYINQLRQQRQEAQQEKSQLNNSSSGSKETLDNNEEETKTPDNYSPNDLAKNTNNG